MPSIQLTNRNINIYYEVYGNPANQPLVLINGLKADHTGWGSVTSELAKEYYTVVFDNRGTGRTLDDGKVFTVETMADDTVALMDALHIQKAHIAGHSLGGAITQAVAKKYASRVHKIALCNTFIKFNVAATQAFQNTLRIHQSGTTQAIIMDSIIPWVFSKTFVTPELRAMIHQFSNDNPYAQSLSGYQRQLDALIRFDSSTWIANLLLAPSLALVVGSQEDITATLQESQELASRIPGAKLEILPGAHASAVEQPVALLRALSTFFKN